MPRQPKKESRIITVIVNGAPIKVVLHPPKGKRRTWYAYWNGLTTSRATGQRDLKDAIVAAENMVANGGKRVTVADAILTDIEFDEIQQRHFNKKMDARAAERAKKSLISCMEAVSAFRTITGIRPITLTTPADCERFQQTAVTLPKNWRVESPEKSGNPKLLSPNTVIKWSVALQAAFERANRNAAGRKCIRGVAEESRLLEDNPWKKFTWIEGYEREIRQFNPNELISILEFLESEWPDVTIAVLAAKTYLWSWSRRSEVASLRWDNLKTVDGEYHFESVGKWGVDKWFRIPSRLYNELLRVRTDSPFVYAAYNAQLRKHHQQSGSPWGRNRMSDEFNPVNFGDWMYRRVKDWAEHRSEKPAYLHVFRKTALQYARRGEDVNRQVAVDARLSEGVMMTNYVSESDEEMRNRSNRTFQRIAASLPPKVAEEYGFDPPSRDSLEEALNAAIAAQNWPLVERIGRELASRDRRQDAG